MTSAENVRGALPRRDSRLRRFFWDGVLPEALGLGFVAIIFAGFTAAYGIADRTWRQQAAATDRLEAETLARLVARTLGTLAVGAEGAAEDLLAGVSQVPRFRAVEWTGPDGQVRAAWPPSLSVAAGPPREPAPAAGLLVAAAPVRTAGGEPAGALRLELVAGARRDPGGLLWNWGIAAGVTLLVFAAAYHRLRRHLRPVAAIERNLHGLAEGVEEELATLTLSDSLGQVARGWNRLIGELTELRRQVQSVAGAGPAADVLARFESATFRQVVDHLPFGVLCVGENRAVTYANAAAAGLLGRGLAEVLEQPLEAAVGDPAVVQALLGARTRAGPGPAVETTRSEGEVETTLRFRAARLAGRPAGGELLVTVEDIGQLRESQRARDNFLYHVTHELRTPLTNIQAYAETLTKPGFDDEQTRKECYNVIISETRRLSRLVEDILSISQLEVGSARLDVGEVDLARLLRQTVQDNLGAADEKRIDLALALPPKVPKVRGDKQRLAVLLNNLIGNAVKYTPAGGQVQVRLEPAGERVRIAVRDNGIGIAPEDQPHVFEKFYRAASETVQTTPGTGLGLALAQEVARLHGGEIRLESQLGEGSTFTVDLPLATGEHAEVAVR